MKLGTLLRKRRRFFVVGALKGRMGFWSWLTGKSRPPPPRVPVYPIRGRDEEFRQTIVALYLSELGREPDPEGLKSWLFNAQYGMTGDRMRQLLHDSAEGVAYRNRPQPLPEPVRTARRGLVRTLGRQFVDDDGPFHPLGATLFWAVNGWRSDRERFKQNALWFRDRGVDYLRIACQAGWVNPDWPDYEQILGEVIDWTYGVGAMRVELFVIGGGARDPMDVAAKVARVINAGRAHKVIYGLGVNEGYNGNLDEEKAVQVTRYMRDHTPNLWAVSDPRPGDAADLGSMVELTRQAHANLFAFEPDRSPRDLDWGMVRQTYDVKEFPGPVAVVEPPGPDSSVRELRSPLQLACMRANAILCGAGAFVFHCGSMVLGSVDPNHPGRVPNIWDVNNIEAMLGAVHDVEKLLPEGVETWRVANTGWTPPLPVAPFQPDALWSGGSDHGVNKAYAALGPDNRFVQLLMGVKGHVVLTASADCQATATDISNGATVESTVKLTGATWRLEGRDDTMTAYLITGRFL